MRADGSDRQQLTNGKWEVNAVQLSNDSKFFYLPTSEKSHLLEQHFYRMPIAGGAREQLTTAVGAHTVELSHPTRP